LSSISKLCAALGFVAVAWLASEHKSSATSGGGTVADIPAEYLAEYRDAADTCPGLDWALLAGIGKVETDHGRSPLPGVTSGSNSAGASGPMQFLGSTFASVRDRHPEVGSDVYDPADAIEAAAHYLCDSGLRAGNEYEAIWAYNHADWYVAKVRSQADEYRAAA
jgi:hypothetical protein